MPSLFSAALSLVALAAAVAPLFAELRRPPEPAPAGPALSPLLVDSGGGVVTTRRAWDRRRAQLRREWDEILGPLPRRVPLQPREVSREELPDHTRLLLRYDTAPGEAGEAYLLLPPHSERKCPGMVVLHQTTGETIREPVGLAGRPSMHIALQLVRRGYACVVPRNFLWSQPGKGLEAITDQVLHGVPGRDPAASTVWKTGMARMLWDGIRATDLLAARPEVDAKRIGAIGHSLGGKEALYLAAWDDRIRACVSCEGGVGLKFSNWEAPWYLGPQIRAPGFRHDHHEVLSLVAPRAFLLVGGESADGAASWPYVAANLPVWRLRGAEERLGLLRHGGGHDYPPAGPAQETLFAWLERWLRGK